MNSPPTTFQFDQDSGRTIISPFPETHAWQEVSCANCGVKGVSLVDTTNKNSRPHFCYKCNPRIVSPSPSHSRKRRSV